MINICEIPFESVIDLCINKMSVIYKVGREAGSVKIMILSDQAFYKYKFELIKWLKKRPNPEDRVMRFETEGDGIWSFKKEQRLIEARKTREEKHDELQEKIWFKQELEKRGIK